jgi:hypothetical protein
MIDIVIKLRDKHKFVFKYIKDIHQLKLDYLIIIIVLLIKMNIKKIVYFINR